MKPMLPRWLLRRQPQREQATARGHYRFSAGERSGWDLDVVPGLRLV